MRYAIIALAFLVAPAHAVHVMNPPTEYVTVLLDYEAEEAVERAWRVVNNKRVPKRIIDNAYLSRWSATVICGEENRGDSINLVLFDTVTNITVDSDDETFSDLWATYCLN
jgi:hypothetical protein